MGIKMPRADIAQVFDAETRLHLGRKIRPSYAEMFLPIRRPAALAISIQKPILGVLAGAPEQRDFGKPDHAEIDIVATSAYSFMVHSLPSPRPPSLLVPSKEGKAVAIER